MAAIMNAAVNAHRPEDLVHTFLEAAAAANTQPNNDAFESVCRAVVHLREHLRGFSVIRAATVCFVADGALLVQLEHLLSSLPQVQQPAGDPCRALEKCIGLLKDVAKGLGSSQRALDRAIEAAAAAAALTQCLRGLARLQGQLGELYNQSGSSSDQRQAAQQAGGLLLSVLPAVRPPAPAPVRPPAPAPVHPPAPAPVRPPAPAPVRPPAPAPVRPPAPAPVRPPAPAPDNTVTVATWNVHKFTYLQENPAHREKLRNIAQSIARSGADIVVLQEVYSDRAVNMLCRELTRLDPVNEGDIGWCYALSDPLEVGSVPERAAFVWRHGSRVRLVGVEEEAVTTTHNLHGQCSAFGVWEGSQPNHPRSMGLTRAIYKGKFSVCTAEGASRAQLHLNSVHITCTGDTALELGVRLPLLVEQMWEDAATAARSGEDGSTDPFFAVLGDFNRDAAHSDFARLGAPAGCRLCPLLQSGVATNFNGDQQYDNAWVPTEQRQSWSDARVLEPMAETAALPRSRYVRRVHPMHHHRLVYMKLTVATSAGDGGRPL